MKNPKVPTFAFSALAIPIFALSTALWSVLQVAGQEIRQHRIDPTTTLLMTEIGAMIEIQDKSADITLSTVLPKSIRPEANRGVDVREGDRVVMLNGQRIRTIPALRELYEGLAEGDEVKMALKREGQPFLVSFAKGGDSDGGSGVRVMRFSGDGDMELFHESRVLLGEQDGAVRVLNQLQGDGDLLAGDIVLTLNDNAIGSLADFRAAYVAASIGQVLTLGLRRGDEEIEIGVMKAERPAGMVIR